MSNPQSSVTPRILIFSSTPTPRGDRLLVDALREAGAEVVTLAVPSDPVEVERRGRPTLADIKSGIDALADTVGALLRGERQAGRSETPIGGDITSLEGAIDAVVATDSRVAAAAFPAAGERWPSTVRVGVGGDFDLDPDWSQAALDDLITPHPTLGRELPRVRRGEARLRAAGPLVAGETAGHRHPRENTLQEVVSFARLDEGDVDPLLFQLSLSHPERVGLLLLPSGRSELDDLVRIRAARYGLRGKRPRPGADLEPWIRGADVLAGRPTPAEAAQAVAAQVPIVLYVPAPQLDGGEAFLVQHGLAVHAASALTVDAQIERVLPGGSERGATIEAFEAFEVDGAPGIARAVLDALRAGRPRTVGASAGAAASTGEPELEDIGDEPSPPQDLGALDARARRAYLREVVLEARELDRHVARARAGLETWRRRARLASMAGDSGLGRQARLRVEGLERVITRLEADAGEVTALRDRLAGPRPLSRADRAAASRLLSSEASDAIDRAESGASHQAFQKLELDDALRHLKERIDRGEGH